MAARTGFLHTILTLLSSSPNGLTSKDISKTLNKSMQRVTVTCKYALEKNLVLRTGTRSSYRWWINPNATIPPKPSLVNRRREARLARELAKQSAVEAPVIIHGVAYIGPARTPGDPVITKKTKITIAPPTAGRFSSNDAPRVIDANNCREWVKRAGY